MISMHDELIRAGQTELMTAELRAGALVEA
jgi:hypothetical protein